MSSASRAGPGPALLSQVPVALGVVLADRLGGLWRRLVPGFLPERPDAARVARRALPSGVTLWLMISFGLEPWGDL